MSASATGTGFSEEKSPFEDKPSETMSQKMHIDPDNPFNLTRRERAKVGVVHVMYDAYYAILDLWLKRRAEGMTQKDIAEKLGRDPAWVSRALGGPANWTLRTLGELAYALNGAVEIRAVPKEDLPPPQTDIYDRLGIGRQAPMQTEAPGNRQTE